MNKVIDIQAHNNYFSNHESIKNILVIVKERNVCKDFFSEIGLTSDQIFVLKGHGNQVFQRTIIYCMTKDTEKCNKNYGKKILT